MSKIIPNAFQTPNLYVDRLMPLLTDTEFRILIYMTRRIIGFQKQEDKISLSQFTDGVVSDATGNRLDYGAGVGKESARIALEKLTSLNIITMISPHDRTKNLPAKWSLQLDDTLINWEALEERKKTSDEAGKTRSAKRKATLSNPVLSASTANEADQPVLADSTGLSQPLAEGCTSGYVEPVLVASTTKDSRKTSLKPEERARADLTGQTPLPPASPSAPFTPNLDDKQTQHADVLAKLNGSADLSPARINASARLIDHRPKFSSPHVKAKLDADGYIAAGQGKTPVEIWYERNSVYDGEVKLTKPQEDDLMKFNGHPHFRDVIIAYDESGFKNRRNLKLVKDWLRDGIPDHKKEKYGASTSKPNGQNDHAQNGAVPQVTAIRSIFREPEPGEYN